MILHSKIQCNNKGKTWNKEKNRDNVVYSCHSPMLQYKTFKFFRVNISAYIIISFLVKNIESKIYNKPLES